MRKLKLVMQTSVDGFVADANGGTNWMVWNWGPEWGWDDALRKTHTDLVTSSGTVVLSGNMAREGFINHWASVGSNPQNPQAAFAKPIADMQKVVFSHTLQQSVWPNTIIATKSLAEGINELKQQPGKDIIVYGGASFAATLIANRLVDEFYAFINPTALGNGLPIFGETGTLTRLTLISSTPYPCGVVVACYAL